MGRKTMYSAREYKKGVHKQSLAVNLGTAHKADVCKSVELSDPSLNKMSVGFYFVLVALCSLQLTNGASTKGEKKVDDSPILFPGPTNEIGNRYGTDDKDIPDECRNQTYCSIKPKDYPQDHFDKMFKGTKASAPVLVLTDNRQGDPDDRTDCESDISYEPLYKVRSRRGWHTVAQAPKENYVQMVRLEKCRDTQSPCFTQFSIHDDVKTFCKQTVSVWEFVVLSADQTSTEKVQVELPICCSCHYKIQEL